MKTKYIAILASLAACGLGMAQTAYTTPVGYVSVTLPASQFTSVGITLQNRIVSAGILDAESSNSVTDTGVNFATLLQAGATYILELADGTIQEITAWNALGVLTTPQNITANVTPGTTTYKLRRASTVSDIFGASNSAGLGIDSNETFTGTDFVQILNSGGSFDSVYYFNNGEVTGWFTTAGDPADNKVIPYPDSLFVKRTSGTPKTLTISGEVKTSPTDGVLNSGFNYVNSVGPVGVTLASSGLSAFLTSTNSEDITAADLVQVQQPNGSYLTAYYFNDGETIGWFTTGGDSADSLELNGGFLIRNKGGVKPYQISLPTFYSNL